MEEIDKNKGKRMISSTTDQKDNVAMNEAGGTKMEEDHKNKAEAKMISSTTDHHQKEAGDDDVAMNEGSTSSDSSTLPSKKRKEGPSETETTSAETSKKRKGRPSGSYSVGKLTLHLNAGEVQHKLTNLYISDATLYFINVLLLYGFGIYYFAGCGGRFICISIFGFE